MPDQPQAQMRDFAPRMTPSVTGLDPRTTPTPIMGEPIIPDGLNVDVTDIALEILMDIVKADRTAATFLVERRCTCNPDLEHHPYIIVSGDKDGPPLLGFLGVLNGILAKAGKPIIEAVFDESEIPTVTGFRRHERNLAES
jgi:hypothetical protein